MDDARAREHLYLLQGRMNLEGVVLSGARGCGKSSLSRKLSELDNRFAHVRAVTTRAQRADDIAGEYEYVSPEQFSALTAAQELRVFTEYSGNSYGIRQSEISAVREAGRIPVLTITPDSAVHFFGITKDGVAERPNISPTYLLVYLRWNDEVLEQRLQSRQPNLTNDAMLENRRQRNHDNALQAHFTYTLDSAPLNRSAELLVALWFNESGVLPARLIHLLLECGTLLNEADSTQVAPASYDLRVGDEIFYGGRIQQLTDSNPFHLIEPYDYAIVTSRESARFPADICARFDLTVSLFCQGVILSNGPQVDPGFSGPLFCLLLNTSSSPVVLKRGQHYATLEFHRLPEPTYPYSGQYFKKKLIDYLPANAAQGAINTLKKEIEALRAESGRLQNLTITIIALILAFLAVWVAIVQVK